MTGVPLRKISAPLPTSVVRRALQLQQWRSPTQFLLHSPPVRSLAQVRPEPLTDLWFTSSAPRSKPTDPRDVLPDTPTPGSGHDPSPPPPSERTLAIGRTLRTLSPLLPNLLSSGVPQNILSPNVTLHLFPSTHQHLPVVKGRVAYRAALFTAPVAWGTVPFVGNVKLKIISERMARSGHCGSMSDSGDEAGDEKLVVRWITEAKQTNGAASTSTAASSASAENTNASLSTLLGGTQPLSTNNEKQFSGLFIFTFDEEGRIASHTIEHADEDNGHERTSRVVTVADWLLGKARGRKEGEIGLVPGLGVAAGGVMPEIIRLARAERARNRWSDRLW